MALLTDLYEVTMAYAYWKREMAEDDAVFHLFFRKTPFGGGYAVSAGLESVIDYLQNWHFNTEDLDYLASVRTAEGESIFEEGFLRYLGEMKLSLDIHAVKEGDVIFPYEPLFRVKGSILQAQLLETPLLTLFNFPTMIATKAARVVSAAAGDEVLEFGMRRAQGIDGAMTASRACYIGGCHATSNALAGKLLGIPVRGTHAHSWVMAFENELQSFQAYAEELPHSCVFLVDTYDSIAGVKNAIKVGEWLREQGRSFGGIRLDSGDIAYLSIQSRKLLDEAGFTDAKIVASNELNEYLIRDLKAQNARVATWGVGTNLVTGQDQGALDGVYKIGAFRKKGKKQWKYCLKFSERMSKTSDPGILQVTRFCHPRYGYIGDAVHDVETSMEKGCEIVDQLDPIRKKRFEPQLEMREMLVPIFTKGECVYKKPSLEEIRVYAAAELSRFDSSIKRFSNPHSYPVGMEQSLYQKKLRLVESIKRKMRESSPHC
ncbi:MAG: nicotinate phosphoribosyltransferase [Chlamydiales bacterium]